MSFTGTETESEMAGIPSKSGLKRLRLPWSCRCPSLTRIRQKNAPDAMVTVNAGMGTPEMAAEWVRWANKKMGYNVKYWEIGNELEGSWELGNTRPDGSKMTAKKYAAIYAPPVRMTPLLLSKS